MENKEEIQVEENQAEVFALGLSRRHRVGMFHQERL